MFKALKKAVAVILALCLAAGVLFGCGSIDAQNPGQSETQKQTEAQKQTETQKEESKVKWKGKISTAPYTFGPIENDVITPKIEELFKTKYNYEIDFEPVFIEFQQYDQLLKLRIASDDAPDVFFANNYDDYIKMDAVATWTEKFFRENAPYVSTLFDEGFPAGTNKQYASIIWAISKTAGKMYNVPTIGAQNGAMLNVVYNKKWLDNLGVTEPPATLDEFVNLMYRFKNEDPDKNGKADTYGFSTSMIDVIFGAYGSFPCFPDKTVEKDDYPHWYIRDGKVINADVVPTNKDALKLLNKLYTDKVLDPEFVTGENQGGHWSISHSFVNGRIGVTGQAPLSSYVKKDTYFAGSPVGTVMAEMEKVQGSDAEAVTGPFIAGSEGKSGGLGRLSITRGALYNKNLEKDTEKLAAIIAVLDIFSKDTELGMLARYGEKDVDYTLDADGVLKTTDGLDNKKANAKGIMMLRNLYGGSGAQPYNIDFYKISLKNPTIVYTNKVKSSKPNMNTIYLNELFESLPSTGKYKEEIKTYRTETWLKIISGDLPIDAYDDYVKEWNKLGGEILTKEANDAYSQR